MAVKIDIVLLDSLTEQAKASPRLRMNLDLRTSDADTSQRMLNAIEPGSVVPIHRHQKTSETFVVLRGKVVEEFYDELERICFATYEVSAGGPVCALNIPAGTWHNVINLGRNPLKVSVIYAPPNHPRGTIHVTKADVKREEC